MSSSVASSSKELDCLLESMLIPFPVKGEINKYIDLRALYDGEHISEDWMQGEIATSSSVELIYHIGEGFRSAARQTLALPQLLFRCSLARVVFFPLISEYQVETFSVIAI